MPFTPIPAVDIKEGRCVRLLRGDFSRETVYGADPVDCARRWQNEGAGRIHVVDLDGARDGVRVNGAVIQRLLAETSVPVQVGGGIRRLQTAKEILAEGADRVVVGTAAVENLTKLAQWVAEVGGEHLVIAVDVRDGFVTTRGWMETTAIKAETFCQALADLGVVRILYTDISRDGMKSGPNVEALGRIARQGRIRVIASGGVATLDDVRALMELGVEGAIIGTALYDGDLRLPEVLTVANQVEAR